MSLPKEIEFFLGQLQEELTLYLAINGFQVGSYAIPKLNEFQGYLRHIYQTLYQLTG